MKLQNGYKIIYEKIVGDERHLYAGKGNIPAIDDVEIKYDTLTEEEVKAFKLIYEDQDCLKGSAKTIPTETDKAFVLTDGAGAVFAGSNYVAAAAEPVVTKATRKAKTKVAVEEPAEEVAVIEE